MGKYHGHHLHSLGMPIAHQCQLVEYRLYKGRLALLQLVFYGLNQGLLGELLILVDTAHAKNPQ